ncbi:hypothetical protein ACFQ5M_03210 [Agrilactobacillus yilanensis]|uniref:Integral membrane protein n=1 Tax=Agrilactobacillus yilanensis TaxID=2485997 RepID=A0ABW4J624_9LACO|nr:hypothetical protein [Agrilactobacillus yilanensis]
MFILTIVMAFFILVVLTLAIYLLRHLDKPFLSFSPAENPELRVLMKVTAYLLIAVCLLGVILLLFQDTHLQLITLLLASFITAFFAVRVSMLS